MSSYGFDMYGRPIMAPPPQYPLVQPSVNHRVEMEALQQKMKEMEAKIYGGNIGQTPVNQPGYEYGSGPGNQVPVAHAATALTVTLVSSFDEAWKKPPDYSGAKHFFYNESEEAMYILWVDENIDRKRLILKPVEVEDCAEAGPEGQIGIAHVVAQLCSLESEIAEIKGMLAGQEYDYVEDEPEPPPPPPPPPVAKKKPAGRAPAKKAVKP